MKIPIKAVVAVAMTDVAHETMTIIMTERASVVHTTNHNHVRISPSSHVHDLLLFFFLYSTYIIQTIVIAVVETDTVLAVTNENILPMVPLHLNTCAKKNSVYLTTLLVLSSERVVRISRESKQLPEQEFSSAQVESSSVAILL
jgi:hypothetical protein